LSALRGKLDSHSIHDQKPKTKHPQLHNHPRPNHPQTNRPPQPNQPHKPPNPPPQVWFISPEFRPPALRMTIEEHTESMRAMIAQMQPKVGCVVGLGLGLGFN